MAKKKTIKPVEVDGELVTPVTGVPAAPRNWAPPCPSCAVRKCLECGGLNDHRLDNCHVITETRGADVLRCAGQLGDREPCPDTRVASRQGRKQFCKCDRCGMTFVNILTPEQVTDR